MIQSPFKKIPKAGIIAVDARDFEPDYDRTFDPEHVTIVAFTRLVYRKGIDLLAVILPDICERHPNVRFLICIPKT